jgi:hypothetical protein
MKRKDYEKPMMEVIECEQEQELLVGSFTATRGKAYEDVEEDPWSE